LCCCLIVSCITASVLLILGLSSLEANEYGIDYSWVSKTINPTIFENGLYFLGIGHSFIKFPKNVQTIEFSRDRHSFNGPINSRTSDGLEVVIEISFQYVLLPQNIYALYNKFGPKYHYVFQNVAIDILSEEATKYTAYEFFWDRGRIKDDFLKNLDKIFSVVCLSRIQFLQLRSVDLPVLFEEAIQLSEVKKQDIKKAEAELNKVKIEVDTRIKSAEFQKSVNINIAQGEAKAILEQNHANTDSLKRNQETQAQAYHKLKSNLSLSTGDLLNLMKTKVLKNYDGRDMALNIVSPEIQK